MVACLLGFYLDPEVFVLIESAVEESKGAVVLGMPGTLILKNQEGRIITIRIISGSIDVADVEEPIEEPAVEQLYQSLQMGEQIL